MIEKGQRPVGRQRSKPERQPSELHRHRVDVDSEEASLGDDAPKASPLGVGHVSGGDDAVTNEGSLVGRREEPAGGNEKRAASHRRVEHS